MNHVTVDGVMQGPGRPDEDTRGGFTQGGWAQRSTEPGDAAGRAMGERMAAGGGLTGWLFGRWTYEQLLSHWNSQPDNPFVTSLNDTHKYVVSASPSTTLQWPNSTLISGDVHGAIRSLKARCTGVLAIMGSGQLVGSLMADNLIDEYLLMIHPLVLGHGQRLFSSAVELKLRLTSSDATSTGLVIAIYEPATD
jgi:dihydrofolate reductase